MNNGFVESMNLDDIFYELRRTILIPERYIDVDADEKTEKNVRTNIKTSVQELCDLLGKRRDEIGILAQAYATLYFRGEVHNIAIDKLPLLKDFGAFVLIVEKEGIAEVLKPFADKYGIALVTSHGFLTENATDLSMLIMNSRLDVSNNMKASIAILTDFDISGLLIGLNIPDIPRIGVDFDTLRYLGYDVNNPRVIADFEERYNPSKSHLKAVKEHKKKAYELSPTYRRLLSDANFDYLTKKRIEINAVKTIAGTENLMKFIMYKLHEIFPKVNYNNAIRVEENAELKIRSLIRLEEIINPRVATIVTKHVKKYKTLLYGYDGSTKLFDDEYENLTHKHKSNDYKTGFLEVETVEQKLLNEFSDRLRKNKSLENIQTEIEKLADNIELGLYDEDDDTESNE